MELSKSWKPAKRHVRWYTGGAITVAGDSSIAALCADKVSLLDTSTGALIRTINEDSGAAASEPVVSFVVSPKDGELVTASRSSRIRVWKQSTGNVIREFKGPSGLVNVMAVDTTGTLLATGCADRVVTVYDLKKKYCTHNFRGHTGMVTVLAWHPDSRSSVTLASGGEDCKIMLWDLKRNACIAKINDHFSVPTAIAFGKTGSEWSLFTAGRDQVINVFNSAYKLKSTVPVFEVLEGLVVLSACGAGAGSVTIATAGAGSVTIATAGNKGHIRVWSCDNDSLALKLEGETYVGMLLGDSEPPAAEATEVPVSQQVTSLLYNAAGNQIVCVTGDQNLLMVDGDTLALKKTLVGYNDDIIDVKYVPSSALDGTTSSKIAVATNSEQLRVFDVETFDVSILSGHSESILSVDASPDGQFIATASKDKTVRVWSVPLNKCVGICEGHTMAVGGVAWPKRAKTFHEAQSPWLISASKDKTIKMWNVAPLLDAASASKKKKAVVSGDVFKLKTKTAVVGHDKDINQVTVSPNDALIASASQDKTVKLWRSTDLSLVSVLRGHKRGVWAIEFSPVDKCIASASGDQTVRIWSVTDFTCVKTLEGHDSSVLSLKFLRLGTQIMSGSADGLMKLWNVKDSECVATIQGHSQRVWTLATAKSRETIAANPATGMEASHVIVERGLITGGGDSVLCVWSDSTAEDEAAAMEAAQALVLEEQELFNRMAARDYERTVELCLKLEQPGRLQAVLSELIDFGPAPKVLLDYTTEMLAEIEEMEQEASGRLWKSVRGATGGSEWVLESSIVSDRRGEGAKRLVAIIHTLSTPHLDRLLRYIRDWNTQSKHNLFAQQLLYCILRAFPASKLKACPSFTDVVKGALPYSERHFERMTRLQQSSYFLDYVQSRMVLALPEDGVEGEAASAKLGDQLIDVFASVIDSAAGGLSEELPVARVVRRVEDAPAPVTVDAAVSLREQGLVGNGGKKRKEGAAAATPAVEAVPEPATDGGKKKKKKSAQSQ